MMVRRMRASNVVQPELVHVEALQASSATAAVILPPARTWA